MGIGIKYRVLQRDTDILQRKKQKDIIYNGEFDPGSG